MVVETPTAVAKLRAPRYIAPGETPAMSPDAQKILYYRQRPHHRYAALTPTAV